MIQHKVLYVSANSRKGGAEQLTLTMAKNHTRSWIPEFYFFEEGPFVEEVRRSGITANLSQLPGRPRLRHPWTVWQCSREIRELITRRGIHLVHSVMGYGHIFGGLASRRSGAAEVWFQHGPTGSLDWLSGLVPSQAVLANSRFTMENEKKYRPRAKIFKVLYPGYGPRVLDEKLKDQASALRNKFAAPGDVVYAMVGRLTQAKGHRDLVQALHLIRTRAPALKLWFVGEPFFAKDHEFRRELIEFAKSLGLERQVIHTGFLENPDAAVLASDVVVNASIVSEGFGLSLLEAMHFSKPVIAPENGGPAELVENSSVGLLFTPGSVEQLAERMFQLYESQERREEMGRHARELAMRRFSTSSMIAELEDVYREVLDL